MSSLSRCSLQLVLAGSDRTAVLVVSGLVEGTYNFTLTAFNKNNMSASDTLTVSVSPDPMTLYTLQVMLQLEGEGEEEGNAFSVVDQVRTGYG